jgi:hypothetical protein
LITVLVLQLAQHAPLADGPAMYFGGTIMTFALPLGAFIAVAIALFYLFRARHSGPRLRWSGGSVASVASVTTWEPGPAPAPEVTYAAPASAAAPASESASAAPASEENDAAPASAPAPAPAPQSASRTSAPEEAAPATETAADETEGKDGEEE